MRPRIKRYSTAIPAAMTPVLDWVLSSPATKMDSNGRVSHHRRMSASRKMEQAKNMAKIRGWSKVPIHRRNWSVNQACRS